MYDQLTANAKTSVQSDIRAVTRLVEAVGGINLGQGVCPLPPSPAVVDAASAAMRAGFNVYSHYDGIAALKEKLADKMRRHNGIPATAENVLVTPGATGAFECVCKAFLQPGDSVVVFEPIYQYHIRQMRERGARVHLVSLRTPDWSIDFGELEAALALRPKLLVFSNPNNPCGKVFTRAELERIGELCARYGVIPVVDEVYEYITTGDQPHVSLASLPGQAERTLTMGSASKTFFVTGWRIGWLVAPAEVMTALGAKADETYVCAPTPFQHAVAAGLDFPDAFFTDLKETFLRKKQLLLNALTAAGFTPSDPAGAYYILAAYPDGFAADDVAAMHRLIEETGVGAIPGREFFPSMERTGYLRFCFAIPDDRLQLGCERLAALRATADDSRSAVPAGVADAELAATA
jgi:aminotransferase